MVSLTDAVYSAASAMNAYGTGMAATAHNVANVNTPDFYPQQVQYQTGPNGQGVQVGAVTQGPYLPPAPQPESAYPSLPLADGLLPPEALAPSQTDLAREFTNMISAQRAYEANAATIRTWDVMQGVIVDLKV